MNDRWGLLVGTRTHSPIRGLDPRAKLIWFLCCFALAVLLREPTGLMVVALAVVVLARLGQVLRGLVSALGALAGFIALVCILNVVYFGPAAGLVAGFKFGLAVSAFTAFFLTTTPEELAVALIRLGVPYGFAFTLATGARFVPTVAREATDILDAYRARGIRFERSLIGRARTYARVLIPLVVSTVSRSLRLAEAMEARAFGYASRRTPPRELSFVTADWLLLGSAIGLAVVATLAEVLP